MKKTSLLIAMLSPLVTLFGCQSSAPQIAMKSAMSAAKVDAGPAIEFWRLVDELRSGGELTDARWKRFLDHPGNVGLVESSYSNEMLTDLRDSVDKVFGRSASPNPVVNSKSQFHDGVLQMKSNEAVLRGLTLDFASPSNLNQAYSHAYRGLPTCFAQKGLIAPDVSIYLHALNGGATALDSPAAIYMSILLVHKDQTHAPGVSLGHEIHHLPRPQRSYRGIRKHDEGMMRALSQILNEGTADLVDGPRKSGNPAYAGWENWIRSTATASLQALDSAIVQLASDKSDVPKADFRKVLNSSGGHIPGFVMVEAIVNAGLRDQLISKVDDPFAFFTLYQEAAHRSTRGEFRFSEVTMKYVADAQRRYSDWHYVGRYDINCTAVPAHVAAK